MPGEEDDVGAHDRGDGSGGTHQWNGGVRVQYIGGRRDQTADDIHEQVPDVAEGLLDVVAEDPETTC